MSAERDDFAAYTTIGDRTVQPTDTRAPLHARPSGPSFAPPPRLEPFLLLAKSARGAAAATLVSQAVAAPAVYVFRELLDLPSIRDLAHNQQHAAYYRLLELFAYGTWADYQAKRDSFPPLTPEQETKLKHLTILTLASSQRVIPYATLLSLLSLSDVPALEDLLIGAFYAHVLHGKLDAKEQRLEVLSAQGRDVRPAPAGAAGPSPQAQAADGSEHMQLDAPISAPVTAAAAQSPQSPATLLASLSAFQATLAGLIGALSAHIDALHAHAATVAADATAHQGRVRAVAEEVVSDKDPAAGGKKNRGGARATAPGAGAGAADDQGEMDVDFAPPSAAAAAGGSAAFPGMSALAGAFGLSSPSAGAGGGAGGGAAPPLGPGGQGMARGAAGSPTGPGAAARARKRNRQ